MISAAHFGVIALRQALSLSHNQTMALIETLTEQISDPALRKALAREITQLKKRLSWGLVFEQHIPETTLLLSGPIRPGSIVYERRSSHPLRFEVEAIEGDELIVVPTAIGAQGESLRIGRTEVLVERRLGEPIYPALRSKGQLRRGDPSRRAHAVIEGENYHALQLLTYTHVGHVDLVYLDPPFNTGARDWRYNNNYVDSNDSYRHSKWLSMMEKRLRLCRRLLAPDGVLIAAIDEHEVHHLRMLLEQMFPEAQIQMVTVVINPKGVTQERFSRVEEYLVFCFFGAASISGVGDDFLTPQSDQDAGENDGRPRWKGLLRSGAASLRRDRESMFFPLLIDPDRGAVVGAGDALPLEEQPDFESRVDGLSTVWPVRSDGQLGRWGVGPETLRRLIANGYVALGGHDERRRTWAVSYLSRMHQEQIAAGVLEVLGHDERRNVIDVRYSDLAGRRVKTVWHRSRHDAGAGGSDLLTKFLGRPGLFQFPKSVYAVRDAMAVTLRAKPDAVIVDPFAGSGTSLHATMLLNAADGGRRQSILITNNEVEDEVARRLHRQGLFRGDPEFEAHGIFEAVARPRVSAAVTGQRGDGTLVPDEYFDGTSHADGFAENVEFFEIDYLDPLDVELGRTFHELLPTLWLAAGGAGERNGLEAGSSIAPAGVPYAFLFDPSGVQHLVVQLSHLGLRHARADRKALGRGRQRGRRSDGPGLRLPPRCG